MAGEADAFSLWTQAAMRSTSWHTEMQPWPSPTPKVPLTPGVLQPSSFQLHPSASSVSANKEKGKQLVRI